MLTGFYNTPLVVVSALVAMIASYVALDIAARLATAHGRERAWWLVGGACAMGFGIWSMHFIGMLAFELPIPQGYAALTTAYSLLIAVGASAFALFIVSQPDLPPVRLVLAAILMGGGIALMHYTGMASMEMQPGIDYDPYWFTLSLVIAIAASGAALWIPFRLRSSSAHPRALRGLAAVLMGVAIVGMHYTGMAAAQFPEGSVCGAALNGGVDARWMALSVGVATFAVLGIALVVSVLDRRMVDRTAQLADSLQRANHELTYLALHDNLTKLPNRVLLGDRLDQAIQKAARSRSRFAVMFVDLDGFKSINDAFGHGAGDRLLRSVSAQIRTAVRDQDTVARIGGDEFVLLVDIVDPEDAAAVASRALEAVSEAIPIEGTDLRVSASIGIAIYPDNGSTGRDLLTNADAAMYVVKEHGRNGYRFFEPSMNEGAHEQLELIQDLRHAIERDQLVIHYQPKLTAPSGPLVGVEALLRWNHPVHGMVQPDRFIPLAEKTGLIVDIGAWVVDEACRQLQAWRSAGIDVPNMAVNLSALQFGAPGLFGMIKGALVRHGLPATALTIEITESTAMRDPESSLAILTELAGQGINISIDDFGTGYSSLMYLKRFPATEIKIDRGFIRDLSAGTEDAAIVSAIVAVGKTLSMEIIAEGVETAEQQRILTALGCHSLQGFLLGKPMAPDDFAASLSDPSL